MSIPTNLHELHINEGLPKSHTFSGVELANQIFPGIIWEEKDISNNGQLLLYRDWASVHFASPWYEIEAIDETGEDATQRDITILQKILGEKFATPATIIDIHCGSGRHAIDLAKKGFRVVGMEEVFVPLEHAREYAKEAHVSADFVLSNRENHMKYQQTADIVISMFNSLGYMFSQQNDQEQFYWAINLLKPGGYFVLDIRSHEYQKRVYAQPITSKELLSIDKSPIATMYTTKFWQNNRLGAIEKIVADEKLLQYMTYGWNTYSDTMLQAMFKKAGAEITAIHQDYYNNPELVGERIFVVVQKEI